MAKKKIKEAVEEITDSREAIDELAEAIVEELKENHAKKLEPFEHYSEKIRMKLHENTGKFRQRFSKGYFLLIEEIQKNPVKK